MMDMIKNKINLKKHQNFFKKIKIKKNKEQIQTWRHN